MATPTTMSNNDDNPLTQPHLNANVYQPMLLENFKKRSNSFHIENPLTYADFPNQEEEDDDFSFLTDLKDIEAEIKCGFGMEDMLNCNQWS
jgi:hypothetical protein